MKITRAQDPDHIEIPFEHEDLLVCVAAASKLLRKKVYQAIDHHVLHLFETSSESELEAFVDEFKPKIVVLGFRFFSRKEFPGKLMDLPSENKPKFILTGTVQELDQKVACKGVDGLLCIPFLPEMLLLKINSLLKPNRCWQAETDLVLAKMRKYQRFTVADVTIHFHKPVQERTKVLDISYQGLKAETSEINPEFIGQVFQMQIACEGAYILIQGYLQWVRDGHVGVRFRNPRPEGFSSFMRAVMVHSLVTD